MFPLLSVDVIVYLDILFSPERLQTVLTYDLFFKVMEPMGKNK